MEAIATIRRRKSYVAGPITGIFGGTFNAPRSAVDDAFGDALLPVERRDLDTTTLDFLEFLEAASQAHQTGEWPARPVEWRPMEDKRFKAFLDFIEEKRDTLKKAAQIQIDFSLIESSELLSWVEYYQIYRQLQKDLAGKEWARELARGILPTCGVAAAVTCVKQTRRDFGRGITAAVFATAAGWGSTRVAVEGVLSQGLFEPDARARRIVDFVETLTGP